MPGAVLTQPLPLHSLWDSDARSRHLASTIDSLYIVPLAHDVCTTCLRRPQARRGLAAAAAAGSACRRYQAHRRRHAAQARSPPASARRQLIVSPQESVLGIRCAVVPSESLRVCVQVRRVLYLVIIDSAGWSCAQLPHLPQDWAHPTPTLHRDLTLPLPHLSRTGPALVTSAPGLGSLLPHLHQDWAHPCHICAGTGLTPTDTERRLALV